MDYCVQWARPWRGGPRPVDPEPEFAFEKFTSTRMAQTITHTTILPPLSIRDIVALIFILLLLPQLVSCVILLTYILSGSTKFLGGKFLARHLLGHQSLDLAYDTWNVNSHYKNKLIGFSLQIFSVNSLVLLVFYYLFPKSWLQYLVILAKSIVASELIGSTTTTTTTITSITSTNPHGHTTTTTTVNNSPKKKPDPRSNASIGHLLICFVLVMYINYFVREWLLAIDIRQFRTVVLHVVRLTALVLQGQPAELFPALVFLALFPSSRFKFSSHPFNRWAIHTAINHLNWLEAAVVRLSLFLWRMSLVLNYVYLVLCIHVVFLTFSPLLSKIILLKDYSRTLDHLLSLTPSIPLDFKRTSLFISSNDEINVEPAPMERKPDIFEVNLDPSISNEPLPHSAPPLSIAAKNFEIFCVTPFSSKPLLKPGTKVNSQKTSAASPPPSSTTIVDKNLVSIVLVQPFWSLLASAKIMFMNPRFFAGQATTTKNSGHRFITGRRGGPVLRISVSYIDATRVIFRVLDTETFRATIDDLEDVAITVNGVDWPYSEFVTGDNEQGEVVLISVYGLTPLYQYEVEFSRKSDGLLLSQFVVNTISSNRAILNKSQEMSPLLTLQSSLVSAIENLNLLKAKYKKLKKDENKRIADIKREIDAYKNKLGKASDARSSSKLKGLKHLVKQLEGDIASLNSSLDNIGLIQEEIHNDYKEEEVTLQHEIDTLEATISHHDSVLASHKAALKQAEHEYQALVAKRKRTISKQHAKTQDIARLNGDLRTLKKNGILHRIHKKQRKVQERFESIMPKVLEARVQLEKELPTD